MAGLLIFWTTARRSLAFGDAAVLILRVGRSFSATVNDPITIMTFPAPFDAEEVLDMPLAYENDDLDEGFEDDALEEDDLDFEDDDFEEEDFEEDFDLDDDEDLDDEDLEFEDDDLDFEEEDEA